MESKEVKKIKKDRENKVKSQKLIKKEDGDTTIQHDKGAV